MDWAWSSQRPLMAEAADRIHGDNGDPTRLGDHYRKRARDYCRQVKVVVSGGFNPQKIRRFEQLGVPVDIYAVGSYLLGNWGPMVMDYTADVVRVKLGGEWVRMAKVGREPYDNPELERVW
jgi:nicotinate phosphoribosyltransferase